MFDKNSSIVKLWVKFIEQGKKAREDIPPLLNLREIVIQELDRKTGTSTTHG